MQVQGTITTVNETYDTAGSPERAFLVGVRDSRIGLQEAESLLRELGGLAKSLGLEIAGTMMVPLRERNPATLVGSGKADEIVAAAKADGATSIIFDTILSPIHQRNMEALAGMSVYDRAELIIDIFASRARTREAVLQVELARLRYSLPRLAHSYGDLHRQRGGRFGTKGSGEQKIELDRRQISRKIHDVEEELEQVRKARATQRKKRERMDLKRAAIVGYTNAGKSSLLNALATSAAVLAEDKLFATLDPTTRRLDTSSGSILVTDTVGFVRNLPHGLVEAFKATLEEAADADLLVHVVDVSDPEAAVQFETTRTVLAEIGVEAGASIVVLNKIDKVNPGSMPLPSLPVSGIAGHAGTGSIGEAGTQTGLEPLQVSAVTGQGLAELLAAIESILTRDMSELTLRVGPSDYAIVAMLYREATVLSEDHDGEATLVRCRVPERLLSRVERFRMR